MVMKCSSDFLVVYVAVFMKTLGKVKKSSQTGNLVK